MTKKYISVIDQRNLEIYKPKDRYILVQVHGSPLGGPEKVHKFTSMDRAASFVHGFERAFVVWDNGNTEQIGTDR